MFGVKLPVMNAGGNFQDEWKAIICQVGSISYVICNYCQLYTHLRASEDEFGLMTSI